MGDDTAVFAAEYDAHCRRKFRHDLPAYAAGVGESAARGGYGNSGEVPLAFGYRLEYGGALGAVCGSVCGVFDITACIYRAVGAEQSRSYLEIRVGRIGVFLRFYGNIYQFLVRHKGTSFRLFL